MSARRIPLASLGIPGPATVAFALALAGAVGAAQSPFDRTFTLGTMRLDFYHTGGPAGEVVALDRIVDDGAWPGSRTRLIDDANLGKYMFEVVDAATSQVVYSRGFASIYGEWETTPEIRSVSRTFHESLRFPWPRGPVEVVLKKRDRENRFGQIWSTAVDPGSRFVNSAGLKAGGVLQPLFENGPAEAKVDLLIIGEGYRESAREKLRADAARLSNALFALEPFKSRRTDFNVRTLHLPSDESGVTRPRAGVFRRTPLSAEYNIFDLERYLLTTDNRALRDYASAAPYEFVVILANDSQYGGGGIFNLQSTVAVDATFAEYVFVHEFGHQFAGLGDEYYTSDVTYETGALQHTEPWEPNVTALHDPLTLKWRDLVEPGTPLPTPWDKAGFEAKGRDLQARRRELRASGASEPEIDARLKDQLGWDSAFLASMTYAGKVGAFEGASYEANGLYRPEVDCIMFTRSPRGFCRVCQRAITRMIDLYAN